MTDPGNVLSGYRAVFENFVLSFKPAFIAAVTVDAFKFHSGLLAEQFYEFISSHETGVILIILLSQPSSVPASKILLLEIVSSPV